MMNELRVRSNVSWKPDRKRFPDDVRSSRGSDSNLMPRLHCSVTQEGCSWTDGQRAAGAHVAGAKSASEATRVLGATLGLSVDDGGELAGLSYGEAPDGISVVMAQKDTA